MINFGIPICFLLAELTILLVGYKLGMLKINQNLNLFGILIIIFLLPFSGYLYILTFPPNHYLLNKLPRIFQIKCSAIFLSKILLIEILFLIMYKLFKFKNIFNSYYTKPVSVNRSLLVDLISISVTILILFDISTLNPLQTLRYILNEDITTLSFIRTSVIANRSHGLLWNSLEIFNLFLGVYYFSSYLINRTKKPFFFIHLFTICTLSFFKLAKVLVFMNLLPLIFCYLLVKKPVLSFIKFLRGASLVFVLMFTTYYLFMTRDIQHIFKAIFYRSFLGQIVGSYLMRYNFGRTIDFLKGASFSHLLSGIFNVKYQEAGRILKEIYCPQSIIEGTGGRINSFFLGEMYATFGKYGAIFLLIIPLLIAFYSLFFTCMLPKNRLSVAFYSVFGAFFCYIFLAGFVYTIYQPTFVILLAIYIALEVVVLIEHRMFMHKN